MAFQSTAFQNNAFQMDDESITRGGFYPDHYRKRLKRLELLTRTKDRTKIEKAVETAKEAREEIESKLEIKPIEIDFNPSDNISEITQTLLAEIALIERMIWMYEQQLDDEEILLLI